jgi:oligopeptide/dipeptide ABC transporter ATP-binding protein
VNVPLLKINDLRVQAGAVTLLENISLSVEKGGTLGIVGESGSGKSMLAWSIMHLLPETVAQVEGTILFDQTNMTKLNDSALRDLRGKKIAMIFQDPKSALNPIRRISDQMRDVIRAHFNEDKDQQNKRMHDFLKFVELSDTERILASYPHQLSGGMLQRVLIAMALCLEPDMLIADEPTTALDATIQLQILELLQKLQKQNNMTMMLISHNFNVVAKLCSQIIVMYGGRICESGPTKILLSDPRHPYTKALLAAKPSANQGEKPLRSIPGTPPAAGIYQQHCKFAPRCGEAQEICFKKVPKPEDDKGRASVCFVVNASGHGENENE